nr:hypothetical protein [Tanacetum cinerariifolium]
GWEWCKEKNGVAPSDKEKIRAIKDGVVPSPTARNRADVAVPLESIRLVSERSSYARALIEVRADVKFKDNIVVAKPKLVGEGFYTCTVHVKYSGNLPGVRVVDSLGDHDNEYKASSIDNDMENFLASKKVGYGTNSLLEQCKETYLNNDYDFDPYDDDMYEGHNIPGKFQSMCDNL